MSDNALNEADEASSLLQMARKLHEQHVSSARAEAARITSHAQEEASRLIADANFESEQTLRRAKSELAGLNEAISKSQEFESTYRSSLKEYLNKLLAEITETDEEPGKKAPAHVVVVPSAPSFTPEVVEETVAPVAVIPELTDDAPATDGLEEVTEPEAAPAPHEAEDSEDLGQVVAITPSKGGAGKSTAVPYELEEVTDPEVVLENTEVTPEVHEEAPEALVEFPSLGDEYTDNSAYAIDELFTAETETEPEAAQEPEAEAPVAEVTEYDNFDSLLESISGIPGAEVDDDGGSSVDDSEDNAPADHVEDEAPEKVKASAKNHPVFESPSVESFNAILSDDDKKDSDDDEKPKFSFFGGKK